MGVGPFRGQRLDGRWLEDDEQQLLPARLRILLSDWLRCEPNRRLPDERAQRGPILDTPTIWRLVCARKQLVASGELLKQSGSNTSEHYEHFRFVFALCFAIVSAIITKTNAGHTNR